MARMITRAASVVLVTNMFAATALAQAPARLTGEDAGAITWVVAVALVLIVSITAFINPKRSHRA